MRHDGQSSLSVFTMEIAFPKKHIVLIDWANFYKNLIHMDDHRFMFNPDKLLRYVAKDDDSYPSPENCFMFCSYGPGNREKYEKLPLFERWKPFFTVKLFERIETKEPKRQAEKGVDVALAQQAIIQYYEHLKSKNHAQPLVVNIFSCDSDFKPTVEFFREKKVEMKVWAVLTSQPGQSSSVALRYKKFLADSLIPLDHIFRPLGFYQNKPGAPYFAYWITLRSEQPLKDVCHGRLCRDLLLFFQDSPLMFTIHWKNKYLSIAFEKADTRDKFCVWLLENVEKAREFNKVSPFECILDKLELTFKENKKTDVIPALRQFSTQHEAAKFGREEKAKQDQFLEKYDKNFEKRFDEKVPIDFVELDRLVSSDDDDYEEDDVFLKEAYKK